MNHASEVRVRLYVSWLLICFLASAAFAGSDLRSEIQEHCQVSGQNSRIETQSIDEGDIAREGEWVSQDSEVPTVQVLLAECLENPNSEDDLDPEESGLTDPEIKTRFQSLTHSCAPLLAASAATLVSAGMTYPLDLKKIRLQSASRESLNFYKGFCPYAVASCIGVSTRLLSYDALKHNDWSPQSAGACSGLLSSLASNPFWVYRVKRSLAGNTANDSYMLKNYLQDFKRDPRLVFRGLTLSLSNVPSYSLYFYLYENINRKIIELRASDDLTSGICDAALAGGSSRLLVAMVTYPIDTIRVIREQTGNSYRRIIHTLAKDGLGRFYNGFAYQAAKTSFSTSIYMGLYKTFKNQLGCEPGT